MVVDVQPAIHANNLTAIRARYDLTGKGPNQEALEP